MKKIVWSDEYIVGVLLIDQQHKTLFKLLNDLYKATEESATIEDALIHAKEVFKELEKYIQIHFRDEEKLMSDANWELLDEHIHAHRKFEARVSDLAKSFEQTENILFPSIITFLEKWLVEHIKGTDTTVGKFLNKKGIH